MKGTASDVLNSYPTTANNYDAAVAAVLKGMKKNHLEDLRKGQRLIMMLNSYLAYWTG